MVTVEVSFKKAVRHLDVQEALVKYDQVLNKLVSDGKLRDSSRGTYMYCLKAVAEWLSDSPTDGSAREDSSTVDPAMGEASREDVMGFRGEVAKDFFKKRGLLYDYRQFIKYVSAIRHFEKGVLGMGRTLLYGETEKELFHEAIKYKNISRHRKGSGVLSDTLIRKINGMRNKKLKLAYRTGMKTGLRVSELADLEKEDIAFAEDGITVNVRDGKGGKSRIVQSLTDDYLSTNLKALIDNSTTKKIFYSTSHMKNTALKLGFQMHDLRRYFSRELLKKELAEGKQRAEAMRAVKTALGHYRKRTTEIYVRKGGKG